MVGTFVRLKLRLLRNGLSIGQGAVLFGIGAFGAGVFGVDRIRHAGVGPR